MPCEQISNELFVSYLFFFIEFVTNRFTYRHITRQIQLRDADDPPFGWHDQSLASGHA